MVLRFPTCKVCGGNWVHIFLTNENVDNNAVEKNEEEVVNNSVNLGNQLNLEIKVGCIYQLLESHSQELINEVARINSTKRRNDW